jgi:Zeta toxin
MKFKIFSTKTTPFNEIISGVSRINPDAIFIRGIPGAGKSTLAKSIVDVRKNVVHIETDDYWLRPDGHYDFNFAMLNEAHEWNQSRFDKLIRAYLTPIVANTFVNIRNLTPYLDSLNVVDEFANVTIIECHGGYKSVHNVPEETVAKMQKNFESSYKSLAIYGTIHHIE